ncbi:MULTISPECIES: 4Fe-4S binding protein [Bacteroides]|uniref:4Fe-4S binding protein n=1 Tax=Bacteroides TaxID=816 RepID=UPI000E430198|nr:MULTISPECIES: 4Fe-4S binding protein [Bacteroides]MBS7573804.1 4Fe-4S dicluster domain-containing protein [Bacteroides propionicigenes]RGM28717.1 ferredoxin [Bacteroides sp. OM08-17BH]HBO06893.1 ferredoxin [Bacteroides sp.]
MNIYAVHLITFSPTHTSKQVGEAIVRGTGLSEITKTDLTLHPAEKLEIPETTLVVVTVPVYGGKVAPLALERMKCIHTSGAPVVLAVVYGNRAYEKALAELDAFISERGFKVIAGATFVGEHSYSTDKNPIAVGRPDADDLRFAENFGAKIRTKIETAAGMDRLYTVDVNRIQRPHQAFFPLFRFLRKVVKLRKSGVPMPRIPAVDVELCNHCGYCATHCPAGAIGKGDECSTDIEKCIRCCACVKGCPQKARTFDTPFAVLLADCFKRQKENRVIL